MLSVWRCLASRGLRAEAGLALRCHAVPAAAASSRPLLLQYSRHRSAATAAATSTEERPQRYGPLDVDLQPRDQLRPLLPTWNPPPTRPPTPEDLEVSTRVRFKFEDRWWAATVRELDGPDGRVRVGFDGWPSRHDEYVERDSDRLYLHESHHAEYTAPPIPKRYQRPTPTDSEGNPLPMTPRPPRPKVFDPEKERMKRALRPPLPYNPEKERLKRLLRGQHAPPVEQSFSEQPNVHAVAPPFSEVRSASHAAPATAVSSMAAGTAAAAPGGSSPVASHAPPPPGALPQKAVAWEEVAGGVDGVRAFRSTTSGEVTKGPPPSGWVSILADGGARYYWHVETKVTQWERPQ